MFGLDLILLSQFRLIVSQQKPYGVHPETWDVASTFTPLVDEKLDRPSSYFGSSVSSLPEADRNSMSFGHFATITHLQFLFKTTPVHGNLNPHSVRT